MICATYWLAERSTKCLNILRLSGMKIITSTSKCFGDIWTAVMVLAYAPVVTTPKATADFKLTCSPHVEMVSDVILFYSQPWLPDSGWLCRAGVLGVNSHFILSNDSLSQNKIQALPDAAHIWTSLGGNKNRYLLFPTELLASVTGLSLVSLLQQCRGFLIKLAFGQNAYSPCTSPNTNMLTAHFPALCGWKS